MELTPKRERLLKEIKVHIVRKWGSQNRGAGFLNLKPATLSRILNGQLNITDQFRKDLVSTGFSPKYFDLIKDEIAERKRRKDEFLLLLEEKNDMILDYKYMCRVQAERIAELVKERDALQKETVKWRKDMEARIEELERRLK